MWTRPLRLYLFILNHTGVRPIWKKRVYFTIFFNLLNYIHFARTYFIDDKHLRLLIKISNSIIYYSHFWKDTYTQTNLYSKNIIWFNARLFQLRCFTTFYFYFRYNTVFFNGPQKLCTFILVLVMSLNLAQGNYKKDIALFSGLF